MKNKTHKLTEKEAYEMIANVRRSIEVEGGELTLDSEKRAINYLLGRIKSEEAINDIKKFYLNKK